VLTPQPGRCQLRGVAYYPLTKLFIVVRDVHRRCGNMVAIERRSWCGSVDFSRTPAASHPARAPKQREHNVDASGEFLRVLANLIGGVVLGVIWQFIFNSALVALANKYDWELFKESWLQDTNKAFWALIIVTVWQSSGYMMIVYITGLVSIENDVLEASQIDGASPLRTLLSIKIPLMAQAFTIALFLTLRSGFMAYDVNVALTDGGPFRTTELISLHIFQDAFLEGDFGTGQSKAVIMFLVVALAALVQVTISKRYEVQR
jgi:raffinose/stachyose/melibiose transport system permease protein